MVNKEQKQIHVHLDKKLYNEVMEILPFHGGLSHVVRISLQNFVNDIKSGKISMKGDSNEEDSIERRAD